MANNDMNTYEALASMMSNQGVRDDPATDLFETLVEAKSQGVIGGTSSTVKVPETKSGLPMAPSTVVKIAIGLIAFLFGGLGITVLMTVIGSIFS